MLKSALCSCVLLLVVLCLSDCSAFEVLTLTKETQDTVTRHKIKTHLLVLVNTNFQDQTDEGKDVLSSIPDLIENLLPLWVPCTGGEDDSVRKHFGIKVLPAILIVEADRGMRSYHHTGPFDRDNVRTFIESYLDGRIEPTTKSMRPKIPRGHDRALEVVGNEFNEKVMLSPKSVLLFIYAPWCAHCKKYAPLYDEIAKKLNSESFLVSKIDGTANSLRHNEIRWLTYPTLYLLPASDKQHPVLLQALEVNEMITQLEPYLGKWVDEHNQTTSASPPRTRPQQGTALHIYSSDTSNFVLKNSIPTHFLLFIDLESEDSSKIVNAFEEVANHYDNDNMVLHVVMPTPGYAETVFNFFQLSDFSTPCALIVETHKVFKHYLFRGSMTYDSLLEFEDMFRAGSLRPRLKSQAPKPQNSRYVYDMVGNEFVNQVISTPDDVVVFFYAPWCGSCQEFAPSFENAAKTLAVIKTLKFAKMDTTQNHVDHEHVVITSYPTLYLFPANDKRHPVEISEREPSLLLEAIQSLVQFETPTVPESVGEPEQESNAGFWHKHPQVQSLNEQKFSQFVAAHPTVGIMFFAPWDPLSKTARGPFGEAALLTSVPFVGVDCAENWDLCEEVGIVAYPTLGVMSNSGKQWTEVDDPTSKDNVLTLVQKHTGGNVVRTVASTPIPTQTPIQTTTKTRTTEKTQKTWTDFRNVVPVLGTQDELEGFREDVGFGGGKGVVVYFAEWCSQSQKLRDEVIDSLGRLNDEGLTVAAVNCEQSWDLCEAAEVVAYPTIVHIRSDGSSVEVESLSELIHNKRHDEL